MDGAALQSVIREIGLSQAEFARLVQVTPRTVSLWVTGAQAVPGSIQLVTELLIDASDATRLRLKSRARGQSDANARGIYRLRYEGDHDYGIAILYFANGKIFGTDDAGTVLDGIFQVNPNNDFINCEMQVFVPAGVDILTGIGQQIGSISFPTKFSFRRQATDYTFDVESLVGVTRNWIRFVRPLPENFEVY